MIIRPRPYSLLSALLVCLALATPTPIGAKNGGGSMDPNAALSAMAAGQNTLAGPGYFQSGSDGNRAIYIVDSGLFPAPDVCITLRNPGPNGRVKLKVFFDGLPSIDTEQLRADLTETRCYAGPTEIRIECAGNRSQNCKAIWRIDRF